MNKKRGRKSITIVGIGASAGGLDACTTFLRALPSDTGMGFILVQHLDPKHESILSYLLSKIASIPVSEAKHDSPVLANHLYVIPHNKDMTIVKGVLKLTARTTLDKIHMPIDRFFISLAKSQKEQSIGIVLSGTATDGTLGLKAIKDAGGITYAQDKTAKYIGMPESAVDSGYVDVILPPDKIARELVNMRSVPSSRGVPIKHKVSDYEDSLTEVFLLLRKRFNVNFSLYKQATIKRRMKRRMFLKRIQTEEEYLDYLRAHTGEVAALYEDFLINVTSFFRDPELSNFLIDSIFPQIVANKTHKESIRIWVPGCSTGEEVYSLAITLVEYLAQHALPMQIQLFGSDISKPAIEVARAGIFSKSDIATISPEQRERFFTPVDTGYQINKSIREVCIFAVQNVLEDPPFSKLDLISCQNLMIYLKSDSQRKVLRTFHYALKPKGFLVLGKSETASVASELFPKIEKKHKVYVKNDLAIRGVIDLPMLLPTLERQRAMLGSSMSEVHKEPFDAQKEADAVLLSHYAPASVVISGDMEIIQFRGATGAYLEPQSGKASFNLIKMAKNGLGFELRSAISKVKKTGNSFRKENIQLKHDGFTRSIAIEVVLLRKKIPDIHFLVIFEPMVRELQEETLPARPKVYGTKDRRIAGLEQEIEQMREDMRSIAEEQETINEELQTANEELLSGNEELQSVNEELGTSKEELESMNEELATVNEEVQIRNDQLGEAREYAESIIRAIKLPLLILDRDLRVRTVNNAFLQTFQVSEAEILDKLLYMLGTGQWNNPKLLSLLREILPNNSSLDNYEIDATLPSIGRRIMLVNAKRLLADGEKILLAIEDITDRREIEKQKDLFIGIASHELKTPLTTVKGYAQILEKRLLASGDTKDAYLIQSINKQTDKVTSLIYDLLNTTKIQSGKLVLDKKKFDIDRLITHCVKDFQQTTSYQILKKGKVTVEAFGDAIRIEQVLINLLTNAVKYSPTADKVIVTVTNDKEHIIVSVQDFGMGIAKQEEQRVFERFYRTNTYESRHITGFGLGLYIAAEIIKEHNGKIWVDSTEGVGSIFSFSLPIVG